MSKSEYAHQSGEHTVRKIGDDEKGCSSSRSRPDNFPATTFSKSDNFRDNVPDNFPGIK